MHTYTCVRHALMSPPHARGGEGGSSRTNEQHSGLKGDRGHVVLELKSIADVGLVGFPNAGKSSLLCAMSRARPRVASYPFTTLRPYIGSLQFDDHFGLRIADIPGLIEGASENVGMGHAFLRHVERTHVLLFMIDVGGFQLSTGSPHRTPLETLQLLAHELDQYQSSMLASRACVIALNKIDTDDAMAHVAAFRAALAASPAMARFHAVPVLPISAQRGDGLPELARTLRALVEDARARTPSEPRETQPVDPEAARFYRQQARHLAG